MMKLLLLIFLLPSHLFIFGVLSRSTITIENKCDQTVWPVIFSWHNIQITTTGFALQQGEAREISAPTSWNGLISGRTLCSTAAGKFSCATGDCESGRIDCPNRGYSWAPVTYAFFNLDLDGSDSYYVNLEYGYNLPIVVVPSQNDNGTCIPTGCAVDNLNMTCPQDLKILQEEKLIACNSSCRKFNTPETCCTNYYKSKETCKPSSYTSNFESACSRARSYAYHNHDTSFNCPSSTDYVITFCPSSSLVNNTIRSSMAPAPLAGNKQDSQRKLKTILGVSTALAVMIIIVTIAIIVRAKSKRGKSNWNDDNIEAVVMLKRYSYENIKKMTKSFSHVLGKGGFGTVYKGKLPDSGRDIALKILKVSNGNREEFINELSSMSIASHVNIVSLVGFCYEGDNRAIICEFMSNGSLDKFISENMSTKRDWKMLYNIAVGVARGLEYLHNSCVSKIVHFDIKPQNILMDEDFCPKITDFGLAKLCKPKDSVISMLYARGTVGYIAPEVFSTNFGGASHKSDVYSYGMVVLEIIGARNVKRGENSESNNSSEYFLDWIYEDLEKKESMKLFGDHTTEEEEKIVKKLAFVGLWCIQTNPSDRPPMRKVVEMLEGSLEGVQVPPKPLLSFHGAIDWDSIDDSQDTSTYSTLNYVERRTL